ncbi:MAG: hypothetical protein JWR67_878 [Mucilaginibacter sp.]|nr:hypothetical protein [Mucilaginibacter sp.]
MPRVKKRNILLLIIVVLFGASYARHKIVVKEFLITGTLQDKQANEASGIAASGMFKDIYYVHNDSGDTSRFFSITPDGKTKSIIYYNGDPKERLGVNDCEDIAVGPGPAAGKSYVYIGDIGDNFGGRPCITIYRIEEKATWAKDSLIKANAIPLHLKYPDGPKDAETLMIDPVKKLICIVSKRRDTVAVYTTPLAYKANDTLVLTKRCKLFFEGVKPFKWITAGDISKDGQQILLKSYEKVYYWHRTGNEPIWQTMQKKPFEPNYKVEKQGEAIGFTPDGKGYYTVSEGVFSPIYYYKVPG